jgi:hypothetical protein
MTFQQAVDHIRKKYPGRYCSIEYTHLIYGNQQDGKEEGRCRVYIDPPQVGGYGKTWETAVADLDEKLYPTPRASCMPEDQAPQGEPKEAS